MKNKIALIAFVSFFLCFLFVFLRHHNQDLLATEAWLPRLILELGAFLLVMLSAYAPG